MTTCSPGKSLVLHRTKRRQGKTKRTNESYSISDDTHIDSNDSGSLSQRNERKKTARKQASDPIDDTTIALCRNEQFYNNFEMKLSSLKAQNWLKNLPFNNHVSTFIVVVDFSLFQLCAI